MVMTLREFYNRIKSLELQTMKEEAVIENKDKIVILNQSQLHAGQTTKERNIRPKYTKSYLKRKNKLSSYEAPDGVPDLYLTGEFYNEMDVIVENEEYFITSFDEKNVWLSERYKDIFGLTKKSKEEATKLVSNTFLKKISYKLLN